MMPSIIPNILLHTLNLLIGILSIAILGLLIHSITLTSTLTLPSSTKGTGRAMLFWPACGGIIDMLLFDFLWFMMGKKRRVSPMSKSVVYFWNGLVFVASFILMRPLITLIYVFVERDGAMKTLGSTQGDGYFTVETWACAASQAGTNVHLTSQLCTDLKAARWLVVPEVICGAAVLGLVLWMRIQFSRESVRIGSVAKV